MRRQIKFKIVPIVSIVFKTNAKEPAQNVSSSKQNSAAFYQKILLSYPSCFYLLFFPIASIFCFFFSFLSFIFLSLPCFSLFFSSLTTSFSVTFERKKSKKVANRQKIINFAPRIVRNAQKRIIIIEKGWGIKATKTLNQKRGRSVCKDNLNEAKLRNYLMKRS